MTQLTPPLDPLLGHLNQLPGYDLNLGLRYAGGKPDRLKKVLLVFKRQHQQTSKNIGALWHAGSKDEVKRLVHTLKGGSSALGAVQLYEVVKDLDDAFKTGDLDDHQFDDHHQQIEQAMAPFMAVFDRYEAAHAAQMASHASFKVGDASLAQFQRLLATIEGYDSEAVDQLDALLNHYSTLAGEPTLLGVRDALQLFEFEGAATQLKAWLHAHQVADNL
ncbi:Hpt domain-containing protein [Magnetococcus sp. PR-3]|uniref:Hpt domain-containing protein n=1 Tax=Magnetococcus sp. PR-3 TaxID=3120355 RepID=UPI002FCE3E31